MEGTHITLHSLSPKDHNHLLIYSSEIPKDLRKSEKSYGTYQSKIRRHGQIIIAAYYLERGHDVRSVRNCH